MSAPTGGLFGSSAIINVREGSAFALDPVAIDNYSTEAQHYLSHDEDNFLLPSLASGNVTTSSMMVTTVAVKAKLVVTDVECTKDAGLLTRMPLTPTVALTLIRLPTCCWLRM